MFEQFRVPVEQLYYHVNAKQLPFNTTKDVSADAQIIGHDVAKSALTFAIECRGKGFNAYVRGLPGSGRKTLVKQVFNTVKPTTRGHQDFCYVHNFKHPNTPRLIILAPGYGHLLKDRMALFCDYVRSDLPQTMNRESVRLERQLIEEQTNRDIAKLYHPLEQSLAKNDLALVNIHEGQQTSLMIAPLYQDEVLSPEKFNELVEQGQLSADDVNDIHQKIPQFQDQLAIISEKAARLAESSYRRIREINQQFARTQIEHHLADIGKKFDHPALTDYLAEVAEDVVSHIISDKPPEIDPTTFYGVNVLSQRFTSDAAPIVFEPAPTLSNLLGAVETEGKMPPYASISAGSLIKANGGFLVVEVDEALAESGTWVMLMRTMRSGKLSFSFEDHFAGQTATIKPEAIPLDVKVIFIGSYQRFFQLNYYEDDFLENVKILVDLETTLPRITETYLQYAQVLRQVVDKEDLLHFDRQAVAKLAEYGIRLSGGKNKVSARLGRIMDCAREANYLAIKNKDKLVGENHVITAIRAAKQRNESPIKQFFEQLDNGTLIVETQGQRIGQINGLAVSQAGTVRYGFPARITATVSPGKSGLINIEGQADLSGNIHTKGFQILGGVLRHILKPEQPLSFSASIAFEQSYGGIDGDSASGAEACCLLSALTKVPIKQSLAMTGAIDQFGQLQAIGGVNEKVEGFFDCCQLAELTGEQGVIIPVANVSDLMLREDVVQACQAGHFHLYAVTHVLDALAILTDTSSCRYELDRCLPYPPDSLLATAMKNTKVLYQQSKD